MSRLPGRRRAAEQEGIWADHLPALQAFLACAGQWRHAVLPNGRLLFMGLDAAGARAALELAGVEVNPQLWSEVAIIVDAAVEAMNNGQ